MNKKQKFSKGFGAGYDHFMFLPEKLLLKNRRSRLISGLKGKILEVGVGTGVNFEYYGPDCLVIGIEPSPFMFEKAENKRNSVVNPNRFKLYNIGCSYPEIENFLPSDSLDAIVVTLVLCTVPEPEKAILKFYEWLKPGGKLVILEHIKSKHKLGASIQNAANPYWEKIGEGCQLNRSTDLLLADSAFRLERQERFHIGIPFIEGVYFK